MPSLGRSLWDGLDPPLSHSTGECRGVGSPGAQVAGPYTSLGRVKRRGDNQNVATFPVPRPAPGHCLAQLSSGRNERVVKRKPWSQAPGLGELAEPCYPGCSISKSACRAVRSIENTLAHKMQQHRCSLEMY